MRIVHVVPYAIVAVVLLSAMKSEKHDETIRAVRFELVDRNGEVRGVWSAEDPNLIEIRLLPTFEQRVRIDASPKGRQDTGFHVELSSKQLFALLTSWDGKGGMSIGGLRDIEGAVFARLFGAEYAVLGLGQPGGQALALGSIRRSPANPSIVLFTDSGEPHAIPVQFLNALFTAYVNRERSSASDGVAPKNRLQTEFETELMRELARELFR